MLAVELVRWWYVKGWSRAAQGAQRRLTRVSQMFSVPILLRTLFSPWRRIITQPGAGIDAHIRALGDNIISRTVGFVVRILVLLTAGIMLALAAVVGLLELLIWPLVPPLILATLVMGVVG